MASTELPAGAPPPRHCCIVKWPDFDGYGFNLHADKTKPGQYIGKVDEGSPAEAAGLLPGDRILEVNGVNIANENHKQVVERIKAVMNETRLLVVDEAADRWYRERKIVVKGTHPHVRRIEAPPVRPRPADTVTEEEEEEEDDGDDEPQVDRGTPAEEDIKEEVVEDTKKEEEEEEEEEVVEDTKKEVQDDEDDDEAASFKSFEQDTSKTASINESQHSTPSSEKRSIGKADLSDSPEKQSSSVTEQVDRENVAETNAEQQHHERSNSQPVSSEVDHGTSNGSAPKAAADNHDLPLSSGSKPSVNNTNELNLNMSVQEMRALLASRKRYDPKKDAIDLRQKYAIIQDM